MINIKRKLISLIFVFYISLSFSFVYAISPSSTLIYEGIDISHWQGNIDFKQVKESGIDIVYIKASQGTNYIDPKFEINYNNAKNNGLKIGFYHFLTATTIEQAYNQAVFFAEVIEGKQVDCKLAMDFEEFYGSSKYNINKIAIAFMEKLKKLTGKDVIVYSNLNNIKNTFGEEVANKGRLWLAYYGNSQNLENIQSSWNTYIGIQYTETGRVPGIER